MNNNHHLHQPDLSPSLLQDQQAALQRTLHWEHQRQQKELYKQVFGKEMSRYCWAGLVAPLFLIMWYIHNRPLMSGVWLLILAGCAAGIYLALSWLTKHRQAWRKMMDEAMYKAMLRKLWRFSIAILVLGIVTAVLTVNEFADAASWAAYLSAFLITAVVTFPAMRDRRNLAWAFTAQAQLYLQIFGQMPESNEVLESWWLEDRHLHLQQ